MYNGRLNLSTQVLAELKKYYSDKLFKTVIVRNVRLSEAVNMLKMGDRNIGEIATETGFSDQSYFSKVFSAKYGVPPSEYAHVKEQITGGDE